MNGVSNMTSDRISPNLIAVLYERDAPASFTAAKVKDFHGLKPYHTSM